MAKRRRTISELEDEVDSLRDEVAELTEENEELELQLGTIADVACGDYEQCEESEEDEDAE